VAVPKRHVSRWRRRMRRSQQKLSGPTVVRCDHCHEPKLSHGVCPSCGYYRGRQILAVKKNEG
jgi:ribosomal protein L32